MGKDIMMFPLPDIIEGYNNADGVLLGIATSE